MRQLARFTLILAFCLGAWSSVGLRAQTNRARSAAESPAGRERTARSQPGPERQRASRPGQGPHRPWTREEWEEHRQELRRLPPEQRRQKIREWRRERMVHWPEVRDLTPEEFRQKRAQLRARLEEHLAELRQKQAAGALTPQEAHRLGRLEELRRRFDVDSAEPPRKRMDKPPEPQSPSEPKR